MGSHTGSFGADGVCANAGVANSNTMAAIFFISSPDLGERGTGQSCGVCIRGAGPIARLSRRERNARPDGSFPLSEIYFEDRVFVAEH
ncbi:MAG: hypothetical protein WB420_04290 [Bradyrhizobium sp.]